MAKKTFALALNGVEVKTLEDLQNNFELEKIVAYFKSGELLDWLNDRFYDDEAEKIENISPDDKNLSQKICVALNVECDEDLEFTQRIREKKKILEEKTDDENIIDNATTTALNQDDLANLLHMDYKKIFLCGENFTVPIRVENKKYIGVLSTPKIKIKANSDEELAAKNISFENCKLAWRKETSMEELVKIASTIFDNIDWKVVHYKTKKIQNYHELDDIAKKIALKKICKEKYNGLEIVYLQVTNDFKSGWAFTKDSFCYSGNLGEGIIKYRDIDSISDVMGSGSNNGLHIFCKNDQRYKVDGWSEGCEVLVGFDYKLMEKIRDFLNVVKNF